MFYTHDEEKIPKNFRSSKPNTNLHIALHTSPLEKRDLVCPLIFLCFSELYLQNVKDMIFILNLNPKGLSFEESWS